METSKKKLSFRVRLVTTAQYIKFFSGPYSLTDKEIIILANLINAEGEICSKENREATSKVMDISKMVLNTYIKRLKDKKALRFTDGKYELSKIFQRHDSVDITILRES